LDGDQFDNIVICTEGKKVSVFSTSLLCKCTLTAENRDAHVYLGSVLIQCCKQINNILLVTCTDMGVTHGFDKTRRSVCILNCS